MSMGRLLCLGVLLLIAGFAGGVAASYFFANAAREGKSTFRLDGAGPIRPIFLRDSRDCNEPTEADRQLDEAMLAAAVSAQNAKHRFGDTDPVERGVVSYFAWSWSFYGKGRCTPPQQKIEQLAPILERAGWPKANTRLNDLRLAERLPASQPLADGLASIGFLGWIPPSDVNGEDARPYARQLLAEQGVFALKWSKQALNEVGGDSRLGTSAAYLAVALNPEAALPKIGEVMADKLRRSRARKNQAYTNGGKVPTIRSDDANRLIELGYALARGGNKSEPYSEPLIEILDEQIARSAPPFGLMAAKPTEFCRIAFRIGGKVAEKAQRKPFCAPDFKGGDGAPRQF